MDPQADIDLVRRVRRGDVNAFGQLVDRYQESVFNVCWRILHNTLDAEDLAQEAFVRGFRKLSQFDEKRAFGPWIHRIAANLSINTLRKRKILFPLDESRDRDPAQAGPESIIQKREQIGAFQEALADLAPHYRSAIELRHFQDMSYAEIADTLGVPLNTARSYLYRARRILAKKLQKS
jgi:RNA polymerase sigma-70 factor (ECF subfamily)